MKRQKKNLKLASRESLAAVHTHTHTHTYNWFK